MRRYNQRHRPSPEPLRERPMLKEKFSILATAFVLLALTSVPARAQQPSPTPESSNEVTTGAITGQVVNERGEPMPGVSVFFRQLGATTAGRSARSEERRVGKECRSRWSPYP